MKRLLLLCLCCLAAAACSTTRVLGPGEYRLAQNKVVLPPDSGLSEGDVSAYIRQKPNSSWLLGWNPMLYVYNWSVREKSFVHKIGTAPVVFDSLSIGTSAANIRNRLEYLGWYGSSVTPRVDISRKNVKVSYIIDPGKRYLVDTLVWDIPVGGDFEADFMADSTAMTEAIVGKYLSEKDLEAESVRSTGRLRDLGYFSLNKNNYSFEADTMPDGTATLIYRVLEYTRNETPDAAVPITRYRIGDVNISRPARMPFRESVLRGLNTIKPGAPYSATAVNNGYSRLASIGAFNSVNVEMTPTDSSTVDCNITLGRAPTQGFKGNLEASVNSTGLISISPQVNYYHRNIFHGGERLNVGVQWDAQWRPSDNTRANEFGVSAGLSFPRFLGLPYRFFPRTVPRTEFNLAFNYQDRPEYKRNIASLNYGYTGLSRNNVSYQIYPLRVSFVKLYSLDPAFAATLENNPFMRYSYQDHLDAGVSGTVYHSSSTDVIPQGSYFFQRVSLDLSGNVLSLFKSMMGENQDGAKTILGSPFSQYARGELSIGKCWSIGSDGKQGVATRLLMGVGYAYGNSSVLPFEKRFYAGGASSMRGWQARALGPGTEQKSDSFIIPSQTGDVKLEANAEYRFKVVSPVEAALFADVGNVWMLPNTAGSEGAVFRFNDFYKSLAADWGIGIRVNLKFLLFRLDFGMQLVDPTQPEGMHLISPSSWLKSGHNALHFGVGYPF